MAWKSADIERWNSNLGNVISAIGTAQLTSVLASAFAPLIRDHHIVMFVMPRNMSPRLEFSNFPKHIEKINTEEWVAGAYLLDPFYRAAFHGPGEGFYQLSALAPKGVTRSEYYRSYYDLTGLIDEVCYLVEPTDNFFVSLTVSRPTDSNRFSKGELQVLQQIEPVVHSVIERHFYDREIKPSQSEREFHNQLKMGLANFARSILTEREREIVKLMLHGHSTKTIAKELEVAIDTVKMHRRNIYLKLKISTQLELFSLVLKSLRYAGQGFNADPYKSYIEGD